MRTIFTGLLPYHEAWTMQRKVHAERCQGYCPDTIIVTEHPNIVTLGRNMSPASYPEIPGVEIVAIDRGGLATAHNPGQLVVYPIVALRARGVGARQYVQVLEDSVIETLTHYGLHSHTNPKFPGVWIADTKICALGVRIARGVSMHGLALNVRNDLALFSRFVPCGIDGGKVTSMARLGVDLTDLDEIGHRLSQCLEENLERVAIDRHASPQRRGESRNHE